MLHRLVEGDSEQVRRGHDTSPQAVCRELLRADAGAGQHPLDQPGDCGRVDRQQAPAGVGQQVATTVEAAEQSSGRIAAGLEPVAQSGEPGTASMPTSAPCRS